VNECKPLVGGASWQVDCDRLQKAEDIVAWIENNVPPDVDLVHKWQGLTLVHLRGQPEPFYVTEATAGLQLLSST
jgi:hypothetical protein